eukprot:g5691.t1
MTEDRSSVKKLKSLLSTSTVKSSKVYCVSGTTPMSQKHQTGPMYKVPGYSVWDHTFQVPLDWNNEVSSERSISIFAREVISSNKSNSQMPYLLYLQGGPGFAATLPIDAGSWLRSATNYFRVILMDQRGTGRSSPITCWNLEQQGSARKQADYLKFFRSDSIVKDAEFLRKSLVPPSVQQGRWSLLGQSFGGFCCVHYLSSAPEGLDEVIITGGIPPKIASENPVDEVYERTYRRVITQNEKYYKRFPNDVLVVHEIMKFLLRQPECSVTLSSGSKLTPRSFQLLGCSGLGFAGGFERLHYLLEDAFDGDQLSLKFLRRFESWMSWETNPLYVILHEPIYSQGPATRWAAHRIRNKLYKDQFDPQKAINEGRPVYFTGEMVYPWMFEDFKELAPLKAAADLIAEEEWTQLYDLDVLKANTVATASATYHEDMFVEFELAQETAKYIKDLRQWVTNEYTHSGLRDDGNKIFEKLLGMTRDSVLLQ